MKKNILLKGFRYGSLFFMVIIFLAFTTTACGQTEKPQTTVVEIIAPDTIAVLNQSPEIDSSSEKLLTIIGVGDMMLGTNYPSKSYLPANGGKNLLDEVRDILAAADLTFGNLEGTILNAGGTAKRCNNPSLCYVFRSPESYVQHFTDAGFDVLSIANNHSGDFGWTGRKKTKEVLKKAGILYAGLAGSDEFVLFEKEGIKYGFCAFAPNSGTCDIRNITKAKQIVAQLEKDADIVIVSFHGGAEGSKHQHVTRKTEHYYGENRGNVHKFAHAVVDAGADIVFGHGPHVIRAAELYKDRFIIYSLGNFCTYGRFNLRGVTGIAPIVELQVNKEGAFRGGQIIPIYQQKTHGPKIDTQKRAIKKLKELTAQDFPKGVLKIDAEGKLSKK